MLHVSPRKRYTFFIDDEMAAGLKLLKERDGIPESEAVRRAIAEFLVARRITLGTKAERKRAPTRKRP
jgi:Ribbon-helix-helix protein, copG family